MANRNIRLWNRRSLDTINALFIDDGQGHYTPSITLGPGNHQEGNKTIRVYSRDGSTFVDSLWIDNGDGTYSLAVSADFGSSPARPSWSVANNLALLAIIPGPDDLHKLALQLDDDTLHILVSLDPVEWAPLDKPVSYSELNNIPSTFPPGTHTHSDLLTKPLDLEAGDILYVPRFITIQNENTGWVGITYGIIPGCDLSITGIFSQITISIDVHTSGWSQAAQTLELRRDSLTGQVLETWYFDTYGSGGHQGGNQHEYLDSYIDNNPTTNHYVLVITDRGGYTIYVGSRLMQLSGMPTSEQVLPLRVEVDGKVLGIIGGIPTYGVASDFGLIPSSGGSFTTGVVVNDSGAGVEGKFRVETDSEQNMIETQPEVDKLYLGGNVNGIEVSKGGGFKLIGTAEYERHVQLVAHSDGSPVNQPSPVDFFTVAGLQYPTTGTKNAFAQWEVPDDWNGGNITFEIDWFPDSGNMSGTDTIKWIVEYRSINPFTNQAINSGISVVLENSDSSDYLQYQTKHSAFTLVYNDANQPIYKQNHIYFRITRDTSVANDFGGSVTVSGYEILYKSTGFPTSG